MSGTNNQGDRQGELALIVRARSGDQSAYRALVDRYKDRLFAFIWRMVRNHHDTEEICQDAFLKAFAAINSFSPEYRFSTWLYTIAYRVCLNRIRRLVPTRSVDVSRLGSSMQKGEAIPDQEAPDSFDSVSSPEADQARRRVWEAVDLLSPPQRAAVLLFYRHEMGCHEIARILEIPVATVKSHLHRARRQLKDHLENSDVGVQFVDRNRTASAG